MEDYNQSPRYGQGYTPNPNYSQNYDDHYDDGGYGQEPNKSIKGLKIMIVIMALILAALSVIYFLQVKQMKDEFAVERDTLTHQLMAMVMQYDTLSSQYDTLSVHFQAERFKADSLLQTLQKERRLNYSKIRSYEKKMDLMQKTMTGYIRQIDSLNTINRKLVNENTTYRKQITSYRLRAETAEEKTQELSTKVRQGSVIRARDIQLLALNNSDKVVSRASRAARLRVDMVLVGNELATPGERNIYVQIIGPDNYVLANASNALFDFEGDKITYSAYRTVDYQNNDLSVSVFYNGAGITSGKYRVKIYTDGHQIGSSEISLR